MTADDAPSSRTSAGSRPDAATVRADQPPGGSPPADDPRPATRRVAVNSLIFAAATGLSRIAGLVREILASSYFGITGSMSAFTIAFQVPNLIRTLVADQAITAAFVPVFTDLLDSGRKRDAVRLASTFFFLILVALGLLTLLFIVIAGVVMPLFVSKNFSQTNVDLTVGLSRVLFPIVVLLGINGLVVGILNAYDHFTVPGLAPLFWNIVILVVLVTLKPLFDGPNQLYAYAIGVLAGTVVQLAVNFPVLRKRGFQFAMAFDWRDPRVMQVFKLMLPVTIGLGAINFVLVVNSTIGGLVSSEAPSAIDRAFRIYMLPQGMFSVALATVLFPALSRFASRQDYDGLRRTVGNGVRQVYLLLIPSAAITMVLATPIVRLIYQRGAFTAHSTSVTATALFWFSFSLPLNGASLMMTRTFFSIQRPWLTTGLGVASVIISAVTAVALHGPFGIAGVVIGSAVGNVFIVAGQMHYLRGPLGGIDGRATLVAAVKMILASTLLAAVAYGVWWGIDHELGRALIAQVLSVGIAITAGFVVYGVAVHLLRVEEAAQIRRLLMGRLRRGRPAT